MMARYNPEELKEMLTKYFTKVYTEQHIEQGYDAQVGQPVWYNADGHPKYDVIGGRLGISGEKVKMSFESWLAAGNTPPGGVKPTPEQKPVQPLQLNTAGASANGVVAPSGGLAETVNTLNQVASLKQAQHNISQIDQAIVPSGNTDLGGVVGALASALAKPRDDTSSMAMMMQMNQQSQQMAQQARNASDERFTALLNIMFQQQAQNQTMMMEAMRGGGTRSALEDRILNKSVDQMLLGNQNPEDTILTQLVQSGQLPEIGKGLLDGVANVLAARQPPSTEQPSYLAQAPVQPQMVPQNPQPVAQPQLPQAMPQPQAQPIQLSFEQKCDVVMEGFHTNLPDTYKQDLAYIGVLKRQVEIAVRRAEDSNPNDIREQLISADKEMHLIVNLRSIAVNINRVAKGEVNPDMAAQVLQGMPLFNDHFRGETYESLISKVEPYAAADPPGQKMFGWDIDFLKSDEAGTVIRQILASANR